MSQTIISKETTPKGGVKLTFCGESQENNMVFANENEYKEFILYLTVLENTGGNAIERLR